MEEVSAIAFGDWHEEFDYQFATAQESRNTYNGQGDPNDFMGPALWPSSLSHFAEETRSRGPSRQSYRYVARESLGMGIAPIQRMCIGTMMATMGNWYATTSKRTMIPARTILRRHGQEIFRRLPTPRPRDPRPHGDEP